MGASSVFQSECCCCPSCLPACASVPVCAQCLGAISSVSEKQYPRPLQACRSRCRTTLSFLSDCLLQVPLSQKCPVKMAVYSCLALIPRTSLRWGFKPTHVSIPHPPGSAHSDHEASALVDDPLFLGHLRGICLLHRSLRGPLLMSHFRPLLLPAPLPEASSALLGWTSTKACICRILSQSATMQSVLTSMSD